MQKKYTYTIFAVALLVVGGLVISKVSTQKHAAPVAVQQVAPVIETVVGRIDLSTKPYTEEAKFIVYAGSTDTPMKEADSLRKGDSRGYVIQKDATETAFIIKVKEDADISMILRGQYEKDANNKLVEHWVDFTSLTVNGTEVLPKTEAVWHNKPFKHVINAKAGETYIISAKWQKHTETTK